MKLVLRSGGKIENRDPFKRSPSGLRVQAMSEAGMNRFKAKEIITLHAVARSLARVGLSTRAANDQ